MATVSLKIKDNVAIPEWVNQVQLRMVGPKGIVVIVDGTIVPSQPEPKKKPMFKKKASGK